MPSATLAPDVLVAMQNVKLVEAGMKPMPVPGATEAAAELPRAAAAGMTPSQASPRPTVSAAAKEAEKMNALVGLTPAQQALLRAPAPAPAQLAQGRRLGEV